MLKRPTERFSLPGFLPVFQMDKLCWRVRPWILSLPSTFSVSHKLNFSDREKKADEKRNSLVSHSALSNAVDFGLL